MLRLESGEPDWAGGCELELTLSMESGDIVKGLAGVRDILSM